MPAPTYHSIYVHGDVYPIAIVRDDHLSDYQKFLQVKSGIDSFYTATSLGTAPTLTSQQKADFAAIQKLHGKTVIFP